MARKVNPNRANDPFHYRHKKFFVGLFVAIPIVVIPVLLLVTLIRSDIFENWMIIHIKSDSASGLIEGRTPVNIMGQEIGHIKDVELNENGYVDVALKVKERYAHFIKLNSRAKIMQKNIVVGDWEVDIVPGEGNAMPVADGDTLVSESTVRLDQVLELFTRMMNPMESIVQSLANGEGLLKYLFGTEDTTLDGFNSILKKIDGVVQNGNMAILNANRLIRGFTAFATNGNKMVDSLMIFAVNATNMVSELNGVVYDIDTLVAEFDSAPADVSGLINKLNKDIGDVEIILDALKHHWFFRRTIKRRELELNKEFENDRKR